MKPTTAGWDGFTGEAVERPELARLYAELKTAIAHDLGFTAYTPVVS